MTLVQPSLILLDCQHDQAEGPEGGIDADNAAVIRRLETLLDRARERGWKICHSQLIGETGLASPPIDALRPWAKESVFKRRGLSAFADPYFHQVLARSAASPILLVGFSAPFSILATVFDAANRDQDLTVVPEACGSLPVAPRSVRETRHMAFDLIGRISPMIHWDTLASRVLASEPELEAPVG